jgi:Cytochrome oxidase complex assembly protein 1
MTVMQQSPTPRRHGCLWGCLAILAVFLLPVALAAGYGAWFWYEGYRHDPVLRGVADLVRHDGMAEQVLGQNIRIEGVEGSALAYVWGQESGAYVVLLAGSKGQGALHVTANEQSGRLDVQSMILDGPDGAHYDLLHHTVQPGDNPTSSI